MAAYSKAQINDISNLAFIGGRTNQRIGAKQPAEYLAEVVKKRGPAALENQCVPLDPALWNWSDTRNFWLRGANCWSSKSMST